MRHTGDNWGNQVSNWHSREFSPEQAVEANAFIETGRRALENFEWLTLQVTNRPDGYIVFEWEVNPFPPVSMEVSA